MHREKHTIQCPCEKAKQFPIVLEFDETKLEGTNTKVSLPPKTAKSK